MCLYYKCFDKEQVVCFHVQREPPFWWKAETEEQMNSLSSSRKKLPFAKVKPDGAAVIRNLSRTQFLRQRKWYRGWIYFPSFEEIRKTGFFYCLPPLPKEQSLRSAPSGRNSEQGLAPRSKYSRRMPQNILGTARVGCLQSRRRDSLKTKKHRFGGAFLLYIFIF